ncbi:MAG: hypothetical protein LBD58_01830 [Treponema sp.]|nr:hypothetical protein [Treponema sp.]
MNEPPRLKGRGNRFSSNMPSDLTIRAVSCPANYAAIKIALKGGAASLTVNE